MIPFQTPLFVNIFAPVGQNESRRLCIQWACNMGSVHCRSDANRELRTLMVSGGEYHQNVRSVLYCAGLSSGNENDFSFVWNRMLSSNEGNMRNLLIAALGCSTTPRLLREFLRCSLNVTNDNDIEYRPGEAYRVFNAVYQNGLIGLEMALEFVFEYRQESFDNFGFTNFENIIIGMSQRVSLSLRDRFIDLLNTVYEENLIADHIPYYANLYMNNNRDWLIRYGDDIANWLKDLD